MSIKIMTRVWDRFPHGGSKLNIALALADFADDHGVAWPSVHTLADKARISDRQVMRITKELQAEGHLAIFPRMHPKHKGPTSNAYILLTGMNQAKTRQAMARLMEIGGDPDNLSGYIPKDPPVNLSEDPRHGRQGTPVISDSAPLTGMSHDPSINHQIPINESKSGAPAPPSPDGDWLKETRIEGESTLDEMSPEDQAKVASPNAPEAAPDPTLPEWEQTMQRGLKGSTLPGDFVSDDVIRYCQRFFDRTSNPPPATKKGNDNWRSGAVASLESFHGSLFTLYESRGQPLPDQDTRRRLFNLCVDVFFTTGAGYDHIRAATPRSLANSMAGLIGDLVEISNFYGLGGTSVLPNAGHIKNWIGEKQHDKKKGGRGRRAKAVDGRVRGSSETEDPTARDRALAARLIAARVGG